MQGSGAVLPHCQLLRNFGNTSWPDQQPEAELPKGTWGRRPRPAASVRLTARQPDVDVVSMRIAVSPKTKLYCAVSPVLAPQRTSATRCPRMVKYTFRLGHGQGPL